VAPVGTGDDETVGVGDPVDVGSVPTPSLSHPTSKLHEVVIVGGGGAGIAVAARLRRAGGTDVAVVEPSDRHHYQPPWGLRNGTFGPPRQGHRRCRIDWCEFILPTCPAL
jgi:Pyridine nucleotide-disulphide oxidoreductase